MLPICRPSLTDRVMLRTDFRMIFGISDRSRRPIDRRTCRPTSFPIWPPRDRPPVIDRCGVALYGAGRAVAGGPQNDGGDGGGGGAYVGAGAGWGAAAGA